MPRRFNEKTFDYREPVARLVGQSVFSAISLALGSFTAFYLSRFSSASLTLGFYAAVVIAVANLFWERLAQRGVPLGRRSGIEDADDEASEKSGIAGYVAVASFAFAIGMGGIAAAFLAVRLMEIGSLRLVTRIFAGLSGLLYCAWDWRRRPEHYADSRSRLINFLTIVGGLVGFVAAFD